MKQILSKLQILRHFTTLLRDTSKTEAVFEMVDRLNRLDSLQDKFEPTAEMQAHLEQPFSQGFPDLNKLAQMPSGSMGRALSDHMGVLGVDFSEFDRKPEPQDMHDTLDRHIYETHDIWHVLTGFGTGPTNEIGLQGFTLAQVEGVPPLTLVTLGLTRCFMGGRDEVVPIIDAITMGWQQGRAAKRLFGVDWRPYLERPLDEVRAEFGIVPVDPSQLVEIPEQIAA